MSHRETTMSLGSLTWPVGRLGEAMKAIGDLCRLSAITPEVCIPPAHVMTGGDELLRNWGEAAAAWLGCDAEPLTIPYMEVDHFLRTAGPSLLRLSGANEAAVASDGSG